MKVVWILMSIVVFAGSNGRTDDPDPVTGLTSKDKYLVQSTYAKLRENPTDNGVTLLSLFFEKYPHYVRLFSFRNLPPSEFSTNPRFRAHATKVIDRLASFVDALNDNDLLVERLIKTGSHHFRRNTPSVAFNHFKGVTIDLFSTLFKPEEVKAWQKTLDAAFSVIIKALEHESEW